MENATSVEPRLRKPEWIRVRLPSGEVFAEVSRAMRRRMLHTVCEEALCPNIAECWGGGTATIMILGDVCTRGCRFCAVKTGRPGGLLDYTEPERVGLAVRDLSLRYVVITSVCRDDLEDGGASIFAETIRAIKARSPSTLVEALIPDFDARPDCIRRVVEARPAVIGHNIETVRRLTPMVRDPRAGYEKSLMTLRIAKSLGGSIYTKSSIMVGLGEKREEVAETMRDLRSAGVDILTIGQYLQPTRSHIPVKEYVHPSVFESYRRMGEEAGFLYVASGPLVRSSYRAAELFIEAMARNRA